MTSRIENILMDSLTSGTAIGIKLKGSDKVIFTAVDSCDLNSTETKTIQIKPVTLYGEPVDSTVINLDEIQSVIPVEVRYDDSVYVKLRQLKEQSLPKSS